ncbi:sodium/proline symporter, partial [candidate division KSB1 bacterium]|nr:sodium/proline symporter [candidate division KSB1 bacterium]
AWRLRDEAEREKAHTFTEFIALKHKAQAQAIRTVSSLIITFFFFFYIGAQFLGGGKTLFNLIGLNEQLGMLLTAMIIIPYTVYGGLRSVVYTDVVQAVVMITTLVVAPLFGFYYLSHHPELFAQSMTAALQKAGPAYTSLSQGLSGFAAGAVIMGGMSWFFGYLGGQPQLSIRFMAIRDVREAKRARNIGLIWTIVAYLGALCIGWIGIALFGPQGLEDQEYVMPAVLLKLFPPALAAILITGAIAAMISTADSLLILCSTELSNNLLRGKNQSPKQRLLQSRLVTAILAVIALLLAYISPSDIIYTLVGYVWAGIGGTFSVVVLLTLFWKKFHGRAALITMISGMLFTIFWISSGLDEIITSRVMTFLFAAAVAVISSCWRCKPSNP